MILVSHVRQNTSRHKKRVASASACVNYPSSYSNQFESLQLGKRKLILESNERALTLLFHIPTDDRDVQKLAQ